MEVRANYVIKHQNMLFQILVDYICDEDKSILLISEALNLLEVTINPDTLNKVLDCIMHKSCIESVLTLAQVSM